MATVEHPELPVATVERPDYPGSLENPVCLGPLEHPEATAEHPMVMAVKPRLLDYSEAAMG